MGVVVQNKVSRFLWATVYCSLRNMIHKHVTSEAELL